MSEDKTRCTEDQDASGIEPLNGADNASGGSIGRRKSTTRKIVSGTLTFKQSAIVRLPLRLVLKSIL